jgi:hypothetical protein
VILHGIHNLHDELEPILRLIRILAEFLVLISLEVHTEETLNWGHAIIKDMHSAMHQVFLILLI